jgi:hypothetical protein
MLLYRLVDPARNLNVGLLLLQLNLFGRFQSVDSSTIPADRVSEITAANTEYLAQRAEFERLRALLRLRVHCLVFFVFVLELLMSLQDKELKLEISKSQTLNDLTSAVFRHARLDELGRFHVVFPP